MFQLSHRKFVYWEFLKHPYDSYTDSDDITLDMVWHTLQNIQPNVKIYKHIQTTAYTYIATKHKKNTV